MVKQAKMGTNRTGIQSSFNNSKELIAIAEATPADVAGNAQLLEAAREDFVANAESIGSVPLPAKLKGMISTAIEKVRGTHAEVFIDKLGERIAFERAGIRLYQALIAKMQVLTNQKGLIDTLKHFCQEEQEHLNIVTNAMISIGGDPTAQTPCADLVGVSSSGILKVITDPRTNVAQSINALLEAELTDNAGWELLIKLARATGQDEQMVLSFEKAWKQEEDHLKTVKRWLEKIIITEAVNF